MTNQTTMQIIEQDYSSHNLADCAMPKHTVYNEKMTIMKVKKYTGRLSPLVIAIIILSLFLTSCVGQGKGKELELAWVASKPGMLSTHYNYSKGVLTGIMVYEYFEVTGGSGEVEITADLVDKGKTTSTFFVEQGKSYKLSVVVKPYREAAIENEFELIYSSPSAVTPKKVLITGKFEDLLLLGDMNLQPWEYSPPHWCLNVYIFGSGSVSVSVGSLVKEEKEGFTTRYYSCEYENGTEVTLTAIPALGHVFDHWDGDVTGESPSVIVHMTGNRLINAHFSGD